MSYVPVADDLAEPVGGRSVKSAAEEFRTLKTRVQRTMRVDESEGELTELPNAGARLDRLPVFNAVTGQLELSAFTNTQIASAIAAAYSSGGTADSIFFIQQGTFAEPRSVQAKLRDVSFHVNDFAKVGRTLTAQLQAAVNAASLYNMPLEFEPIDYVVDDPISVVGGSLHMYCRGSRKATIKTANTEIVCFEALGELKAATTLSVSAELGSRRITVASAAQILVGDLVRLSSTKAWYSDPRTANAAGNDGFNFAQAGGATTITLAAGTVATGFVGLKISLVGGTGIGQGRTVTAYNPATKVCTVNRAWKTNPNNTTTYRFQELSKGEFHCVRNKVGNVVELELPLFDGYDVVDNANGDGLEDVTVEIYTPIQFYAENMRFENLAALNGNTIALRVQYAKDIFVRRCEGSQGMQASFDFRDIYRGVAEYNVVEGANDTSAGYGIQVSNATMVMVRNNTCYNCRRGVDVSAHDVPSRYCSVIFNEVYGGGFQEDGQGYYPLGPIDNFGVGSHGGSEGTIFAWNKLYNVKYGVNLRGINERVLNNFFIGFMTAPILLDHGFNWEIAYNVYDDTFTQGSNVPFKEIADLDGVGANIYAYHAEHFILMHVGIQRGRLAVHDNTAYAVKRSFMHMDGPGEDQWDWDVQRNNIRIQSNLNGDELNLITIDSGAMNIFNSAIRDNQVYVGNSNAVIYQKYGAGVTYVGDTSQDGVNRLDNPSPQVKKIADDTFASFRVGSRANKCHFSLVCTDGTTVRFFGFLDINSTTIVPMGASSNVAGLAVKPTGADGADNLVNINYDGDFLHVVNRIGTTLSVVITVFDLGA